MPDRCTPECERVLAEFGALLPYRRARTQRRTVQVGGRLECEAIATSRALQPLVEAETIAFSIDSGHVRAVRSYQVRTFEVIVAQASNDKGEQIVFSGVSVETDQQSHQLRGVLPPHDTPRIRMLPKLVWIGEIVEMPIGAVAPMELVHFARRRAPSMVLRPRPVPYGPGRSLSLIDRGSRGLLTLGCSACRQRSN